MAFSPSLALLLVVLHTSTAAADFRDEETLLEKPDFLQLIQDYFKPDLLDLIRRLNLSAFYDYTTKTGLVEELALEGPFTISAPSSVAFNTIPLWQKMAFKNHTFMAKAIRYHVLQDEVTSYDVINEMLVPTLASMDARLNVYDNEVITVQCSPIDQQRRDKMASNGVLHVITRVMVPPYGTLVDALSACPAFSTLLRALEFTGLLDLLRGDGPFTMFAPTDSAFASMSEHTRQYLFSHKAVFTDVILYHLVNGTYCSAGFPQTTVLDSLGGEQLVISHTGGAVRVNRAIVVPHGADGSVTNGVVHSIDAVLLNFSS